MALVLGIDGGGTKTACVVAKDGKIIGEAVTGPSNLVRSTEAVVRESIHSAIKQACKAAGVDAAAVEGACFGLAGLSGDRVPERTKAIGEEVLRCSLEIVEDTMIGLDAAAKGGPGVIAIAGTGSNTLGRNERGEYARAGGWGSVISDEGSGFWIGRQAVSESFRAMDADRPTTLMQYIMDAWGLSSFEQLIVKANAHPQPAFAELMPAVLKSADGGDEVAREVFARAGAELARSALDVVRKLWKPGESTTVYMVGGVFDNSAYVRESFTKTISSARSELKTALCTDRPVMGALFRAERMTARSVAHT